MACAKAAAPPPVCVATPAAQALKQAGASRGLLPSGRGIAPLGESLQVGQSPQSLALAPDHINFSFVDLPTSFLARPDTEKLPVFLAALNAGKLDPFTFVALQYDHTFGLAAGKPTPDSMIADNDRATGLLVEAVSHSPYWSDTLILITEDDPVPKQLADDDDD